MGARGESPFGLRHVTFPVRLVESSGSVAPLKSGPLQILLQGGHQHFGGKLFRVDLKFSAFDLGL